jgi:hypothetical protein
MKQNTKRLIIGLTIFTLLFTGGFSIKETFAQTTNTETKTTLETISQLLSLIVQRLSVFSVKDGKVGIGTNDPVSQLDVVGGWIASEGEPIISYFPNENRTVIRSKGNTIREGAGIDLNNEDHATAPNQLYLMAGPGGNVHIKGDLQIDGQVEAITPWNHNIESFDIGDGKYAFNTNEHPNPDHSLPFSTGLLIVEWRLKVNSVWQTAYQFEKADCFYKRYGNPEKEEWGSWYKYCGEEI